MAWFWKMQNKISERYGKNNSVKVQSVMTNHTISVVKYLQRIKLIDISIAISGLGKKIVEDGLKN